MVLHACLTGRIAVFAESLRKIEKDHTAQSTCLHEQKNLIQRLENHLYRMQEMTGFNTVRDQKKLYDSIEIRSSVEPFEKLLLPVYSFLLLLLII